MKVSLIIQLPVHKNDLLYQFTMVKYSHKRIKQSKVKLEGTCIERVNGMENDNSLPFPELNE